MIKMKNGFELRELTEDAFDLIFQKHAPAFFNDVNQTLVLKEVFDEAEKEKLKLLRQNSGTPYHLRLGIFKDDQLAGWHWGFQETALNYYMCNSAILPEFRGQGLYTELLPLVLKIVTEKGFQEVTSRHSPTNNAIIVPKLKAGFVINSMEVTDIFGVLVCLVYYPHKVRNKVLAYRTGYIRPDEEIKKHLKL